MKNNNNNNNKNNNNNNNFRKYFFNQQNLNKKESGALGAHKSKPRKDMREVVYILKIKI